MLYAYFSLIFERISVKLGWYIGSISSINPMNFQVRTPNFMIPVRQKNSSIHPVYFVHRDNKPRPVQSVSLDVSTKNSVDGPSKATIQSEGRPPCRGSLQVQSNAGRDLYYRSLMLVNSGPSEFGTR